MNIKKNRENEYGFWTPHPKITLSANFYENLIENFFKLFFRLEVTFTWKGLIYQTKI